MKRKFSTGFAWATCLLALSTSAGVGCKEKKVEPGAASPSDVPIDEVTLTEQQAKDAKIELSEIADQVVSDAVVTSGRVTFDDLRVSHIYSPVTGRITRIDAELGQRVKKGDALAVIESPDVGIASSDLGKAQADLIAAEHDFNRQKELFESHAASQKDFEASEDNFRKARAELQRAKQKARIFGTASVDAVTQGFTLRAAIDGEVMLRTVTRGLEVQGQYGGGTANELFTIGELDKVWVMADVYEIDISRVKVGQRVSVHVVAYPDKTFEGKVDLVSSTLDPVTRTARIRCILDNKDNALKPEMYATVHLFVEERKTLALPHSALLHLGDSTVVFLDIGKAPDGKLRFRRVPVTVDEGEGGEWVPLLRGPEKGKRVVTAGAILLSGML